MYVYVFRNVISIKIWFFIKKVGNQIGFEIIPRKIYFVIPKIKVKKKIKLEPTKILISSVKFISK